MSDIFLFALPIKEAAIVDHFLPDLKDEVVKICPVQKMTSAGQRSRFKAFVLVGDEKGHVGLGVKCSREVATSIRGAITIAKLSLVPVRMGYWGGIFGEPHTVPVKVTGKCGSVRFRLIPAPRGTGLVAGRIPKKVLSFCGVTDCYTSSTGSTSTQGNFVFAAFHAAANTYKYLTPDLWEKNVVAKSPYQEFTDFLKDHNTGDKTAKKVN